MFKKVVFISGATGFIGRHLAAKFVKLNYQIIALARPKNGVSARQRLIEAILEVDPTLKITSDNLIVINGSMDEVATAWIRQIREITQVEIDEVWHLAAIFKISKQTQAEVEAINIKGVGQILELVLNINVHQKPRYFHVSTAYSQGRGSRVIYEQLYEDNEFRSLYDWSKNGGERQVEAFQKAHSLDVTILRPSIVVTSKGSKVLNNAAYYAVLETMYSVKKTG